MLMFKVKMINYGDIIQENSIFYFILFHKK